MGRLFELLLLIGLATIVWRLVKNALTQGSGAAGGRDDAPRFEPTGRCAKCSTHVPRGQLDAAALCPRCRAPA